MDASLIVFLVGTLVGSYCGGGGSMLVRTILAPPDPRLMWTVIFWTSCDHWNTLESLGKACHLKGDYHHAEDDIGNKQQIESERYWRWYAGLACTILANTTRSSGIISVLPRSLSPWTCRHFAICDGYRQQAQTQRNLNGWNMPRCENLRNFFLNFSLGLLLLLKFQFLQFLPILIIIPSYFA